MDLVDTLNFCIENLSPFSEFYCSCCKVQFEYQSKYERHLESKKHKFQAKLFTEYDPEEIPLVQAHEQNEQTVILLHVSLCTFLHF